MSRISKRLTGFWIGLVGSLLIATSALSQTNNKNALPQIGVVASDAVTLDKEQLIGDALMRQLRGQAPIVQDPVLQQYIQDLGNRLVVHADNANFPFTFFVINNPDINAFAFFGGHIGMHTGLIARADNESEVASVVAHEVAHVTQRHIARRIQAQKRTSPLAIASLIGGILLAMADPEAGLAAITASQAAGAQFAIDYTRSNEQEADRIGISMLARAGYDPRGAESFFSKLAAETRLVSRPPQRLLSHPLTESRIADARSRIANLPRVRSAPSLAFYLAKSRILARYHYTENFSLEFFENARKNRNVAYPEALDYGYALALLRNDKVKEAGAALEPLLKKRPANQFYLDTATDIAVAMQQPQQAIALLTPHFKLSPRNAVLALNLANSHMEAKEYDTAVSILRDFLLIDDDNQLAYRLLADAYLGADQRSQMHQSKAEALALSGGYKLAVDELQFAYNFTGDDNLQKQRIRARIKQLRDEEERLRTL